MADAISEFKIDIPDEAVADLFRRLEYSRIPEPIDGDSSTSRDGISYNALRDLLERWKTSFDWGEQQRQLNAHSMFLAHLADAAPVHFVHAQSPRADARPLLLVHGWPGSFAEFRHVIAPLTRPAAAAGSKQTPAFHLVIPSLPGFGFSPAPAGRIPALSVAHVADLLVRLMRSLGYTRFFVQAGDWGSMITKKMAIKYPQNCVAIHLNLAIAPLPKAISYFPQRILLAINPALVLTPAEIKGLQRTMNFAKKETAYFKIQGTKPYTLGVGLNDSPAGLLAWIAEKMLWNDIDPTDILTHVCIYWFTQSITPSFRIYRDNFRDSTDATFVPVPTAIALFNDISQPPEAWMRYVCNLKRFTRMPRGGHFAALEQPELLVDDLRAFFGAPDIAKLVPVSKKGKSKL